METDKTNYTKDGAGIESGANECLEEMVVVKDKNLSEQNASTKWNLIKEIAAGTFDWYCAFLPGIGPKIRKKVLGRAADKIDKEKQELSDTILKNVKKSDNKFTGSIHQAMFSGQARTVYDSMTRLDALDSIDKFWSCWNPGITDATTSKVYRALGGNKRPVISTLGTFAYSGLFLHVAVVAPVLFGVYVATNDVEYVSPAISVATTFTAFGVPIAANKMLKKNQKPKEMKEKYGWADHAKAAITGGIMAAYVCGAWELGQYVADSLLK